MTRTMNTDENDVSPTADLDPSQIPLLDSWYPPEPFEADLSAEEWGQINFDDTIFNFPDHLIPDQSANMTKSDHQPTITTSSIPASDFELVNTVQPTDEIPSTKPDNTQTPEGGPDESPGSAGIARRLRRSERSVTVRSRPDLGTRRESSTLSSTMDLTPSSSSDRQEAKRKREKDDGESLAQTRRVRAMGACCDENEPCERCIRVAGSVKLFGQPCQRVDLADVIPFRTGNARMGQTDSVFPNPLWSVGNPIRTTAVTHFFERVDVALLPKLKLMCRQFTPTEGDILFEHYEDADGKVVVVECPPVACINIATKKTKEALEGYMQEIWPYAVREMLATSKDEIYRHGLTEANRLASMTNNPAPMLRQALEILACVHINFDTPILVGDTLDVPILKDKRSPIQGRYPVPSVLDFQLDTLCIQHMQKLMKAVSRGLKKIIFSKDRQSRWYEIFLTIFVLLVSVEQVYLTQYEYLKGATIANDQVNIFARASPVTSHMVSLWRASAKNLLYHYRCIMKATLPFSPSFKLENEGYALLDADAMQYIRKTAAL
ncbi:hypothetical protein CEP51_013881 [Fusarium floridanum]|uniref:Uncharacterized protein n=1 Tax=Fusarium floridanum TaxID=1325733 RepID=A0A428Q395_9HYPO|nr:hypothetical protein CEP51_013881 [Fusarium floridanum]